MLAWGNRILSNYYYNSILPWYHLQYICIELAVWKEPEVMISEDRGVREICGLEYNEYYMTSCYIHEHCAFVRANIMADIERALYWWLVGFLNFKTSLGIPIPRRLQFGEFVSKQRTFMPIASVCTCRICVCTLKLDARRHGVHNYWQIWREWYSIAWFHS